MLFRQADRKHLKKIDRNGNINKKEQNKKNIKERKCSRKRMADLFAPMSRLCVKLTGRVSFCTSGHALKKASLAIETAIVLPLFFMGMVTMISFMDVYKLETEKLAGLCEKTKEAGMYAYVLDESGPIEITLPELYSYQPIGGWISLPKVWLYNTVKVHAWTGRDASETYDPEEDEDKEEQMVFLTENGSVYHVDPNCSYIQLSIEKISDSEVASRTNEYGEHYDACKTCSRHQAPADTVFITDSGTAYHNLETCSGLKRTVRLVPESQVEGMHVCSRCGAEGRIDGTSVDSSGN